MGSVPLDPQFMGMNKADLASRVTRAEQLMNKYADENDRLDQENDALRGVSNFWRWSTRRRSSR